MDVLAQWNHATRIIAHDVGAVECASLLWIARCRRSTVLMRFAYYSRRLVHDCFDGPAPSHTVSQQWQLAGNENCVHGLISHNLQGWAPSTHSHSHSLTNSSYQAKTGKTKEEPFPISVRRTIPQPELASEWDIDE